MYLPLGGASPSGKWNAGGISILLLMETWTLGGLSLEAAVVTDRPELSGENIRK